jgi:glycine betaine/choline ABC-type transport system substrate-binding protein
MDRRQVVAGLTSAAVLWCCGRQRRLRVGSKNFTEQVVLGEIVSQHVEARLGLAVDRKLDLGGTLLAHQALTSGAIDLYPEYTGTALTAVLRLPPLTEPEAVFERVRDEYKKRFELVWLEPLGFDDSFAMVIRSELARREGLATLSDAAAYKQGWRLGVGYEFLDRPDGLEALRKTYGLRLEGAPKTMDLGLLYRALEQGEVTMVAGNTTDGLLSVLDVTVLRDDRRAFPPYQAALVVRPEPLTAYRALRGVLAELSGRFTERLMQSLNHAVDGEHRSIREVAASFLRRLKPVQGRLVGVQ